MKWMLGVVLALGLTGCSWQDDVKVRGEGAVVEQQHPLGREVTRVLAGVPAAMLLNVGVKHLVQRARPVVSEPLLHLSTYSFPSGHSMAAFSLYGGVSK